MSASKSANWVKKLRRWRFRKISIKPIISVKRRRLLPDDPQPRSAPCVWIVTDFSLSAAARPDAARHACRSSSASCHNIRRILPTLSAARSASKVSAINSRSALRMMSGALRVGLGFRQAIILVTEEVPNPARRELLRVIGRANIGINILDALDETEPQRPQQRDAHVRSRRTRSTADGRRSREGPRKISRHDSRPPPRRTQDERADVAGPHGSADHRRVARARRRLRHADAARYEGSDASHSSRAGACSESRRCSSKLAAAFVLSKILKSWTHNG